MDISRAFDRVWHEGLKYKLKCLGIENSLYSWLCSYLCNRNQKVVLNGCESSYRFTNDGVPQGSILGPLLFLIFINDFEKNLNADVYLFADDATISKTYSNTNKLAAQQCLNDDLKSVELWANKWMVEFNVNKTNFVNFSLKKGSKSQLNLMFKEININEVAEHKHLGVILTSDLKWSKHIDSCCSKGLKKLGLLRSQENSRGRRKKPSISELSGRPLSTVLFYILAVLCKILLV